MCDTCGCNVTPANEHLVAADGHLAKTSGGNESVEVLKGLLDANDHQAAHNREHFERHDVLAVNLMSSPGAGKSRMSFSVNVPEPGDRTPRFTICELSTSPGWLKPNGFCSAGTSDSKAIKNLSTGASGFSELSK